METVFSQITEVPSATNRVRYTTLEEYNLSRGRLIGVSNFYNINVRVPFIPPPINEYTNANGYRRWIEYPEEYDYDYDYDDEETEEENEYEDLVALEDEKITLKEEEFNELQDEIFQRRCVICIKKFNDNDKLKVLKCKHSFHSSCIKKWLLERSVQCPNCRTDQRKST